MKREHSDFLAKAALILGYFGLFMLIVPFILGSGVLLVSILFGLWALGLVFLTKFIYWFTIIFLIIVIFEKLFKKDVEKLEIETIK